jgi:hypothetical protein
LFGGAVPAVAPTAFAPPLAAASAPPGAADIAGLTHWLAAGAGSWHQAVRSPPHLLG